MGQALADDPGLVRDGSKTIRIKGKAGAGEFARQLLRRQQDGKRKRLIPINSFFEGIGRGKGVVSKHLTRDAVAAALVSSYRDSERSIGCQLGKETIRRTVLQKGEQAKELEKTTVPAAAGEVQAEAAEATRIKDAETAGDTYKTGRAGTMRSLFGKIFVRRILYLMADGVSVAWQGGQAHRECKVGLLLRQTEGRIERTAAFCTWQRVDGFRRMLEWVLLGIFSAAYPVVIISDGAEWIRKLRGRIPCLEAAVWILDWFHLKENTLKLLRTFGMDAESARARDILALLWLGQAETALAAIAALPLSADAVLAAEQQAAVGKYKTYVSNQREGIINYQAFKMKGYIVGSGSVEKLNDTLVKDRMVRQKRMRWGTEGGEAMMQLLTAKWNGRLQELFA